MFFATTIKPGGGLHVDGTLAILNALLMFRQIWLHRDAGRQEMHTVLVILNLETGNLLV